MTNRNTNIIAPKIIKDLEDCVYLIYGNAETCARMFPIIASLFPTAEIHSHKNHVIIIDFEHLHVNGITE